MTRIVDFRKAFRKAVFLFFILAGAILFFCSSVQAKNASALELTYDGTTHTYKGIQGHIFFGNREITLSTIPVIKLKKTLYIPAQEVLETILGYTFRFDGDSGLFTAEDADLGLSVSFAADSFEFKVSQNGSENTVDMDQPINMISKNGESAVPCVPADCFLKALGMKTSWNQKKALYTIQKQRIFDWTGEKAGEDPSLNQITRAESSFEIVDNMGTLHLLFHGDRQDSFDKVNVKRTDKLMTITIPESRFLPQNKQFGRFGAIVEQMSIDEAENTVKITLNCYEVTEFTYSAADNKLHLRLLWDYSTATGKETNFSLTIKRPDVNCLIDQVSLEDLYDSVYYKKEFQIIIKGDHVSFYKDNPVVINNNSVKKVKVKRNKSGNTVIHVYTRSLQACKVFRQGEEFVVQIQPPKKLYKNVVILDAGHGEHDNGCTEYGFYEKNLNLKMICTLMKKYFNQPDGDTKVYWTRRTDKFVTLEDRSKFASKVKADVFISLHMNWATNKAANGTEVYYSTDNNKSSFSGLRSSIMAEMMDSALVDTLENDDRGVRTAGFYVIKRNTVPAILIELGFLSGNKDHKKLVDPDYQKKATKTMAEVIRNIFEKYPTGR